MKKEIKGLDYSLILNEWEKYFFEIHQLKADFFGVAIPKANDDTFPWFGCIPESFSTERAYSGGKQLYSKWRLDDEALDGILDLSFGRDSQTEPYIVRFRANWEAGEAFKNLSAIAIAEEQINMSTLKERLLLGDFLFWKQKKHLDVENMTLCSGSRYSDGCVPYVGWSPHLRGLHVSMPYPDIALCPSYPRKVVS